MYKEEKHIRFVLFGLITLLSIMASYSCKEDNTNTRESLKVLIIQSYRSDLSWGDDLNNGAIDAFRNAGIPVRTEVFYLDSEGLSEEYQIQSLNIFLNEIYEPDLILLSGDQALNIFLKTKHPFTVTAPVVFSGVDYLDESLLSDYTNITGFTTAPDYQRTYSLMKELFPDMEGIVLDIDDSDMSAKALAEFQRQIESIEEEIDYRIVNMDQSEGRALLYSDTEEENFIRIMPVWNSFYAGRVRNTNKAFFAVNNEGFGIGYLGGYIVPSYDQMYEAAELGIQILRGVTISDLKIRPAQKQLVFDWMQLHKYNITIDKLPDDVVFVDYTLLDRYQKQIISISAVIFVLIICVSVLLVFLSREAQHVKNKTQKELMEHRSRLKIVMSSIREGVISIDKNMNIFAINPAALNGLQLNDEESEYIGRNILNFLDITDSESNSIRKIINVVYNGIRSVTFNDDCKMKSKLVGLDFPVAGNVSAIYQNDNLYGAVIVFNNISEEYTEREFLQLTLKAGGFSSWHFDKKTFRLVFDGSFIQKEHMPSDEHNSISLDDFAKMIHPEDLDGWYSVNNRLINSEFEKFSYNVRVNVDGNGYQWWEIRFTCLRSLDPNTPPSIFGLCSNVEKSVQTLKSLEQARDKAQMSDKLKSAFLANMSHEIRSPLNAIVGFANVLTSGEEFEQEERQAFIETIRNNCNLLLGLISDVLDLAQIESGTMNYKEEICDVNEFINQIVVTQGVIIPDKLQLISDIPEETVTIIIDKLRLNQVITNLINNAVKFTKKGSVTVGYQNENDGWLHFYVEDTGKGIPEKDLNNIFERFFKKDDFAQGAGLGLSICKMIIDHYNGEINVTSKEDVGSRFTASIPYIGVNGKEKPKSKKVKKIKKNNTKKLFEMNTANGNLSPDRVTLLIAEDEDSNYLLLKTVLQKHCNLIRAKTGLEALALFKESQVDLVLLDIKMPEMTGIEALKEIRKLNTEIPVIMQSAYVFDTDMEAARQAGATDFITKPINLKVLKSTISKFCPSVLW